MLFQSVDGDEVFVGEKRRSMCSFFRELEEENDETYCKQEETYTEIPYHIEVINAVLGSQTESDSFDTLRHFVEFGDVKKGLWEMQWVKPRDHANSFTFDCFRCADYLGYRKGLIVFSDIIMRTFFWECSQRELHSFVEFKDVIEFKTILSNWRFRMSSDLMTAIFYNTIRYNLWKHFDLLLNFFKSELHNYRWVFVRQKITDMPLWVAIQFGTSWETVQLLMDTYISIDFFEDCFDLGGFADPFAWAEQHNKNFFHKIKNMYRTLYDRYIKSRKKRKRNGC